MLEKLFDTMERIERYITSDGFFYTLMTLTLVLLAFNMIRSCI